MRMKLKDILTEVLQEAPLQTYGDLRNFLKMLFAKQKGLKLYSKGKEVAIEYALGFLPGAAAAKTTFGFFKAAFDKPDAKKTDTWLDRLDIDDDMSAIVDDTVEDAFLKALVKMVEAEPADKQLELDFNINEKLKDWLSKNYNQRTIDVKGIDLKKQKKGKVFK